jgi:exodeoxyribonuclease-3
MSSESDSTTTNKKASFKVATWNVNSMRVREEQVIAWLNEHQPDALCLQEIKMVEADFPFKAIKATGYSSIALGQKTYNGVAILSKREAQNVSTALDDFEDEQRRYIAADIAGANGELVRVVNVYVPNGQTLDSDKFVYKQAWFKALRKTMRRTLSEHPLTVLLGDFNITPSDLDCHDPVAWRGKIHCSDTERLMLHTLLSQGLYDTYRHFNPQGEHYSWWDYRGAGYRANAGLRIDLVLSSGELLKRSTASSIDEVPRKHERPSDHTPVVAEYSI